jgi:hypothetical protein
LVLNGSVCDRGPAPQPTAVGGAFFDGDPANGGKLLCTAQTPAPIASGQCVDVSCTASSAPAAMFTLYMRVGANGGVAGECNVGNDVAFSQEPGCRNQAAQ